MPKITIHKNGETHVGEIAADSNLVVLAGIRKFPYPHLSYGCGMGKCAKCRSRILDGADQFAAPNWKEKKTLGDRLDEGYRLVCQLRVFEDVELAQD